MFTSEVKDSDQRFQERMDEDVRQGCRLILILAIVLFPAFNVLDYYTEHDHFRILSLIRLATAVFCAPLYLAPRNGFFQRNPFIWGVTILAFASISVTAMCLALKGYESRYYAGINLIILIAGLLFPWGARKMTFVISLIVGIYLFGVLGQVHFHVAHPQALLNSLAFLLASAVVSIAKANHGFAILKESFHAKKDLNESLDFLDSLIENLPNMIFVKDANSLRFVRFNKAGEDLLGYSRKELIGKNDYDFFPIAQAEAFISRDREVLRGKKIVDIPEEQINTKNDGTRILHTKKIPLFGANGEPQYLFGRSEDITDIKQAAAKRIQFMATASSDLASFSLDYHKALRALGAFIVSELCDICTLSIVKDKFNFERVVAIHKDPSKKGLMEKLKLIKPFELGRPGGVGTVLLNGQSRLFNHLTDSQLEGESASEEHFQALKELGVRHSLNVAIRARDKIIGSMSLLNSDDRTFSSEDKLFVEELGRRTGIAIENALLYDKAQEAIRTRDDFLSVASHELKTPITSLGLQLTLAQKSSSPERVGKALDLSQKQVRRLTKLIEDLLDVTRIGTGKLLYNYEKTDLTVLVSETLDRHREQLKDTSSSVEFEGRESISVECDPYRIEQVVSNLLTNAAKYGDSGPVKVGVQQIGECAQFFVQDSGIGIPPERLDKIFERFERGNAPKGISGLGLGLFISREIVKNHGGQITVDSTPGKGSLFIVVLPIVQNSKTN